MDDDAGQQWTATAVRRILDSPALLGRCGGVEYESVQPVEM